MALSVGQRAVCAFTLVSVVGSLTALTIVLTSDITPKGHDFYEVLENQSERQNLIFLGGVFAVLGFICDMTLWKGFWRYGARLWAVLTGVVFLMGLLCCTNQAPTIPVIAGIFFINFGAYIMRQLFFSKLSVEDFSGCCGLAFSLCGVASLTVWLLWVFHGGFLGRHIWDDTLLSRLDTHGIERKTGFILWVSPLIVSVSLMLVALFASMRSRLHADTVDGIVMTIFLKNANFRKVEVVNPDAIHSLQDAIQKIVAKKAEVHTPMVTVRVSRCMMHCTINTQDHSEAKDDLIKGKLQAGDLSQEIFRQVSHHKTVGECAEGAIEVSAIEFTQESIDEIYVGREIKCVIMLLAFAILGLWIASSLNAGSVRLTQAIVRLSCALILGIVLFLGLSIGLDRLENAAEHDSSIAGLVSVIQSDWMKGFFILMLGPVVPIYFVVELLHQSVRIVLVHAGAEMKEIGVSCLTVRAERHWRHMTTRWDWTSVLTKAMMCGILYFFVNVGCGRGITIFLSWFQESIEDQSLFAILAIVFAVGIFLFLLPPIPGVPIYLVSGIVVVQRCMDVGLGWNCGVGISIGFCFVIKMTAIVLQQKAIGEPFAHNVTVRKMVGVQTVAMRAIENILSRKGFHVDKISVLVGGPDWPTSVLTGVLKLSLSDMLLGSTPCLLLITPVVLASAFIIRAGVDTGAKDQWLCLSRIMLMVSALTQSGSAVMAGYYIQSEVSQHEEELNKPREGDHDVLELEKKEKQYRKQCRRKAGWLVTPFWMRGVLVLGVLLMTFAMHIAVSPEEIRDGLGTGLAGKAFQDFTLQDKISDLENGDPLNLINPPGWIAFYLLAASSLCLCIHDGFCAYRMRTGDSGKCEEKIAIVEGFGDQSYQTTSKPPKSS